MWSIEKPRRTIDIGTTKPRMADMTGNTSSVAVKINTASHYGRFICAAKIAASRSRIRTSPTVIPANCSPSSFTVSDVGEGEGCAVVVTVTVGAGDGSEVAEGCGPLVGSVVGSGDGEGEICPSFTTVTTFPLEVPHDVPNECAKESEGKK
jgi:hypothetical protein